MLIRASTRRRLSAGTGEGDRRGRGGESDPVRCGTCGAESRAGARFCDQCGSRLEPRRRRTSAERPPRAEHEPGDRRIVTAVFADLVDYVRLVAEYDAEVVRARVDAALTAMGEAIEAFGGTREKFIGDAVFAVFGWPVGHDDDA